MSLTEFWLISAPGDKTCQQTWEKLNNVTSKPTAMSMNNKFNIPDLKVGTLDVLVGLSDELGKLDAYVESVARKLAHYLGEVLEDTKDRLAENLTANGVDLTSYVTRFQWDLAKYPIKQPLKNITEIISKQVTQMDGDLKTKASAYNNLKGTLQSLERKATGSLLTRNLGDLVKKEDFISNSEYLVTLLVVVPKASFQEWEVKYEKLADMVVPKSSRKIYEDTEHGLFTVTLFQKVVDEYKLHARENRFTVRDFTYNEQALAAGKDELNKLAADKKRQYGPLVRWLKINFSEAFMAWIHVKALRVFVESVLRYGLPVNFQPMLLQPFKKSHKKLRENLAVLYAHLDSNAGTATDSGYDIPGLMMSQQEYYAYVYYPININFWDRI
ncbi:V-type proton ATPase subunit C 1-A-like [Acanthaster planci]|uniref:V-type proton ATPase subunit C n=1 Tax=Acanthaster planci TaxID=133434 RepID=A0A8B7YSY4_ACAPL|nr:V-type proton ATPase subunit C 1-A-like [Acanthaster planci]XP_022096399.1 V-type proton ATPase subunit C 1-A-like [Acanthaster planci]